MRSSILFSLVFSSLGFLARAEDVSCDNPLISVTGGDPEINQRTCEAVRHAERLFQRCNVPAFQKPIQISIVEEIEPYCVAQFHCDDNSIEILEPSAMDEQRDSEGAFGFLPINAYYRSIVVHELAHAAYQIVPCPYQTCVATSEYVAYAMQVMSLGSRNRLKFESAAGIDRHISDDELNAVILYMSPDLFTRKVWTHLSQSGDSCAYIGKITGGTVFLDRDEP